MDIIAKLAKILKDDWFVVSASRTTTGKWIVKAKNYDGFAIWDYIPNKGIIGLSNSLFTKIEAVADLEFRSRIEVCHALM